MSREIVETDLMDSEKLAYLSTLLERDCSNSTEVPIESSEIEQIVKYNFTEELSGLNGYRGEVSLNIYDDYFRAVGDRDLIEDYFAKPVINY